MVWCCLVFYSVGKGKVMVLGIAGGSGDIIVELVFVGLL